MNWSLLRQLLALSFAGFLFLTASVFAADDYCYKGSYGRGVGTIPSDCGEKDNSAGLCYPKCQAGYTGALTTCYQNCPSGYIDTGALCHIDKALTHSGTWKCTTRDIFGTCWWSELTCPSGYTNAGLFCALNTPSVPAGYTGLTGLDLAKHSYTRGVGTIPPNCSVGKKKQNGLCYKDCNAGYDGEGPVCWNTCPSGHSSCGAGCATSSKYCAEVTANQVLSSLNLVANVATMGASGEAASAAKSVEEASQAKSMISKGKEAWKALKATEEYKAYKETKDGIKFANSMENLSTAQSDEDALRALSTFDPTGISQVISAFAQKVCAPTPGATSPPPPTTQEQPCDESLAGFSDSACDAALVKCFENWQLPAADHRTDPTLNYYVATLRDPAVTQACQDMTQRKKDTPQVTPRSPLRQFWVPTLHFHW